MNNESAKIISLFGTRVRQLRYARGWNQVDLAAALDWKVTRSAISYIENGKKCPSVETLIDISRVFSVEPAALLLQPWTNPRHAAANGILACPAGANYCCIQSICINCYMNHGGAKAKSQTLENVPVEEINELLKDKSDEENVPERK